MFKNIKIFLIGFVLGAGFVLLWPVLKWILRLIF